MLLLSNQLNSNYGEREFEYIVEISRISVQLSCVAEQHMNFVCIRSCHHCILHSS